MTAEEILVRAAELVERPGGWCQKQFTDSNDAVCLRAALARADMGDTYMRADLILQLSANGVAAHAAVVREVGEDLLARWDDPGLLARWNDAGGRTAEEVATALRNAKRHLVAP